MFRIDSLAFTVACCVLLGGPVFAQSTQPSDMSPQGTQPQGTPENDDSRFGFFHVDGGYLRLDGRTGRVSMCVRREAGWLCQALPDERAAFEAEIARLQGDNAALKKVVLAHDLPLPAGVRPDSPPSPSADHEVNQIMNVIGSVWHRLVAMIVSVQKDLLEPS